MKKTRRFTHYFMTIAASITISIAAPALANEPNKPFSISSQTLNQALLKFSKQADVQIFFDNELVNGLNSMAINATMNTNAALQKLLQGTGLVFEQTDQMTYLIKKINYDPQTSNDSTKKINREKESAIDEIIVTAQKRQQKLSDVPMSISALSQDDLDQSGIDGLLELGATVPSLTVVESGPGQTRIFMRGAANGNSLTSLVGIYLDEMPVTVTSLAQLDLRLLDLERVEVLRGPQGTLYGEGSAGGTLRLITRDPDLNEISGNGNVSLYNTKHGGFSQEVNGILNIPVIDNVLGLRISGTIGNIDGWIDQPAAGRKDINDQDLKNLRAKMLWQPSDAMDIKATYVVHRNDGNGITAGADQNHNVYFGFDPDAQEYFVDNYDLFNITVTYDFDTVQLLSASSYMNTEKKTGGISLELPPSTESFNRDTIDTEVFSQEVRLSSSGDADLGWVAGVFYRDESLDRLLNVDLADNNEYLFTIPLPTDNQSKSWAVFGDTSYRLNDRLEVGVGLRYFSDDRDSLGQSDTFTSVDPRLYLSYRLTDEVNLYANAAEGFRSGGFGGGIGAEASFGPENVRSYEVGIKGALLDGQLNGDIALFFSDYKDIQTFRLGSDGVTGILTNAGDAEIKGIDISLELAIGAQFTLLANGNYTDAKLTAVAPGATTQFAGDPVDFVNDYSLSASGVYEFNWTDSSPGFLRIDYNRISPSQLTDRSIPVFFKSDRIELLNARLGIELSSWNVQIFGQNLLDENGIQDPLEAIGVGSRPRPRTIGIKVGTNF